MTLLRRRVVVDAENGIHARPAAELVRLAQPHDSPVLIRTDEGRHADLSSVLALMQLSVADGEAVTIEVDDSAAAPALLDAIADVLAPLSRR